MSFSLRSLFLCLVLIATPCCSSAGSGASSLSPTPTPTGQTSGDSGTGGTNLSNPVGAADGAASPQEVTGAYLTDCANVGPNGFGCAVTNSTTHQAPSGVQGVGVTVSYTDGSSEQPPVTMAPAGSPWLIFFTVASAKLPLIASFKVAASLGGVPLNLGALPYAAVTSQPPSLAAVAAASSFIFVSSKTYLPGDSPTTMVQLNSSGKYNTDTICQNLGGGSKVIPNAASLTWTTMVSVENTPAQTGGNPASINAYVDTPTTPTGPIVNTAGQTVAATMAALWGTHTVPIVTDENGLYVGSQAAVWTGSDSGGNLIAGATCNGWSSATASANAVVGRSDSLSTWFDTGTMQPCNIPAHVYCFGTP